MLENINSENWSLELDKQNRAWLTFDRKDSKLNTLSVEILDELNLIIEKLKTSIHPKGLIIKSGKKSGFIAGADIAQFKSLATEENAITLIKQGQDVINKLAAVDFPTCAMVRGFALGGGMELALACDYIVAEDDSKTVLGLPEVLLGIQPGWGGSIRMLERVGSLKGLDLILTGRLTKSKPAAKLGIVDAAVPLRHLETAVLHYIDKQPALKRAGGVEKLFNLRLIREFVANIMRKKVKEKANPKHYPAPFLMIDTWAEHYINSNQAMLIEAKAIAKLMVTPTARNLVEVFFKKEKLKSLAKGIDMNIKHVHVVGAGVMGGDIAAWCAFSGFNVTLSDPNMDSIAKTISRANKLFQKKFKRQTHLIDAAMDRLTADPKAMGVAQADLIIEAIVENEAVKQDLFAKLESEAKETAVLATNTSTIPLNKISEKMNNKNRVVGIHFFNPVAMMPLVEVVSDDNTDKRMIDLAIAFVGKINKLPLPVKSSPGFLVNRVLVPYIMESMLLLEEGVPAGIIDKAALDFGMPMGPIELADTIGLDVCVAAAKTLGAKVTDKVTKMVADGILGKKTNKGFYSYNKKGKPIKEKITSEVPQDVTDRLIMQLLNESVACLRENIVADEDLLDAGMIFGTGFAPFRGGPMSYIKDQEKVELKQRLDQLQSRYGDRFVADSGW